MKLIRSVSANLCISGGRQRYSFWTASHSSLHSLQR